MKSRSVIKFTGLLMLGVMAAGSLFAAEERNVPAEASKLLKEVQSSATKLALEAETLDSYSRGGISRQSHGIRLSVVRDHLNTMGLRLARLQAIREEAAPWQQDAIASIVPVAANLASHIEAAIVHLNQSGQPLWHPDYTGHLQAIADRSDRVKKTIDVHLEMASLEDPLEQLRDCVN